MSRLLIVTIKVLIVLAVAAVLFFQLVIVPAAASQVSQEMPGVAYLRTAGIVGSIALLACVQVVLVCVWRLVDLASAGRLFDRRAFVWVDGAIAAIWVAVGLVIVGSVALTVIGAGPPVLFFAAPIAVIFGAGAALVVGVMRSLLRQAVTLRTELDEVV